MSKKTPGRKSWLHPPNLLTEGHVVYHVKLLGHVTVDSPKGADVVKEAIRKVKFNQQVQRAEGTKPRKVEITISHKALGVQEKQSKISLHSFALQLISYCADDKSDKKICAFIARNDLSQTHECFVLESEKSQAEDITLTVGQAFDLAYQQYKENLNKDPAAASKKLKQFQDRINTLEEENKNLRARVAELEEKLGIVSTLDKEDEKKERASSTSSSNSQPFVFQLESFGGGTSSTDPGDHSEDISNIFGPPLENIAEVNGTANHNTSQQNGLIFEESFNSAPSQRNADISAGSTSATPVLAPPPRPTRQKRRQPPPPSLLGATSPNNNDIKSPPVIPAASATNPFQDEGDWTKSLSSPPPVQTGDLIFNAQQPKATKELTFEDLDPFAS